MNHEFDAKIDADTTAKVGRPSAELLVLLTVALGMMLAPLNSTMIAVALPAEIDAFEVGVASAGWLVIGYLVTMASLQPIAGKIGDRLGRRRLVLVGLAFFGLVSLGAAVAPNLWVLLLFRTLQAVAGALIIPNGVAIVREVVPEERRARAFGLIGAAVAVAAALGPPLGGLLVEAAGWPAIFYVNLALVVPALLLGWRWLPRVYPSGNSTRIDTAGAVMLAIVLVAIVGLLMSIGRGPNLLMVIVGGLVVIVIAIAFVVREIKHPEPIIPPRLFSRRAFASACGSIGLGNLAMYTLLLSVPLLLADRSESSSLQSGLVLTSLSASMIILAPIGGRLADKFGRRLPTSVGFTLMVIGALPIALLGTGIALPALIGGLTLVGTGLGLSMPGLQTTAVESVSAKEAGVAAGVYSTSRYLGSILGAAILMGFLGADRSNTDGLAVVFVIVLVAAALATLVSLGLQPRPEAYSGEQDESSISAPRR